MRSKARMRFLVPAALTAELRMFERMPPEKYPVAYVDGIYIWGLQTYHELKARGVPVELGAQFKPDAINIGHAKWLNAIRYRYGSFVVGIQADCARNYTGDAVTVVQNQSQLIPGRPRHWIPHWSQPGLENGRNRAREAGPPRLVGYGGRTEGNEAAIGEIRRITSELGLDFEVAGERDWHDLGRFDVLLGIRTLDRNEHANKPPTKLLNACIAGIPFIGGWDSAYTQVATPGRDYLRVGSTDELSAALASLKQDRELRRSLIENGTKIAEKYSRSAIAKHWEEMMMGLIPKAHAEWCLNPGRQMATYAKTKMHEWLTRRIAKARVAR